MKRYNIKIETSKTRGKYYLYPSLYFSKNYVAQYLSCGIGYKRIVIRRYYNRIIDKFKRLAKNPDKFKDDFNKTLAMHGKLKNKPI